MGHERDVQVFDHGDGTSTTVTRTGENTWTATDEQGRWAGTATTVDQ